MAVEKKEQRLDQEQDTRDVAPRDPVASKLLPYFDHGWDFIYGKPSKKIKWRKESRYCLTKRNLWKDWQREDKVIGLGFGNNTRRVMIDIDADSPYHPDNNEDKYRELLDTLHDLGLCSPILIRSSFSGGLHIYYFLNQEVPSYYASYTIEVTLLAKNFVVKNGQLEIFPNTKSYSTKEKSFSSFKAHRLPLQPGMGSCILSSFSLEYKGTSLEKFASMVEMSAQDNDVEHFSRMIELCKENKPRFWDHVKKRNKVSEWKRHLTDFIEDGWTDNHQTNIILCKIGQLQHIFEEKTGKELVQSMVEIATALPGYRQYCRHQHEIERRCSDWAKAVQKFNRILYTHPKREENYQQMFNKTSQETPNQNQQKAKSASNKIEQAYNHLINTVGEIPKKIGEIVKLIKHTAKELTGEGIAKNTLFKEHNLSIWHPKYRVNNQLKLEETANIEIVDNNIITTKLVTLECNIEEKENVENDLDIKSNKKTTEERVRQDNLQIEALENKDSSRHLTPCKVVCKKEEKLESLETISNNDSSNSSHTLPYMKCIEPSIPNIGAALGGQHPKYQDEVKGGYGGEFPKTGSQNSQELGKIGQNSSFSGENDHSYPSSQNQDLQVQLTGSSTQPDRTLGVSGVKEKMQKAFLEVISSLPMKEKMSCFQERLTLYNKGKKRAESAMRFSFSKLKDKNIDSSLVELLYVVGFLKITEIEALKAECQVWQQVIKDKCFVLTESQIEALRTIDSILPTFYPEKEIDRGREMCVKVRESNKTEIR
jgi:hypothetical protein